MPRPRKEKTRMARIKLSDISRLKNLARKAKMSLPDYISKITRELK